MIADLLCAVGPEYTYGLRSIELCPGRHDDYPCFGRLFVPGRIALYAQPPTPWILPGELSPAELARLLRAGARVTLRGGFQMVVDWPGVTLREFMLRDVLLHELGHHRLQQYGGKRLVPAARTRDHEAVAEQVARCWQRHKSTNT